MLRLITTFALLILPISLSNSLAIEHSKTLLTRVIEYQYPDSKLHQSSMSDAATLDAKGQRTAPSVFCKTLMTTSDSVQKVLAFYKKELAGPPTSVKKGSAKAQPAAARSVMFHSGSSERAVKLHVICINQSTTSTTLVISRGTDETETHIAWSQYERIALDTAR